MSKTHVRWSATPVQFNTGPVVVVVVDVLVDVEVDVPGRTKPDWNDPRIVVRAWLLKTNSKVPPSTAP